MERIDELIIKDKFASLEQVSEILKEEMTSVARNFLLLADDVVVRYKKDKGGYVFNVEIPASRIKPFGNRLF